MLRGIEFDQSADVYSFGCCLWEIFTGSDLAGFGSGIQLADKCVGSDISFLFYSVNTFPSELEKAGDLRSLQTWFQKWPS